MTFIHKNVNSALLMLIVFISVALVTATVYSVEAFDSINEAYAEKAIYAESLAAELASKEAMTDDLKKAAQLTQEREQALTEIIKQRQAEEEQARADTQTITVPDTPAKKAATAPGTTYKSPYRTRFYGGFTPQKKYVI
jgi:hypothetical protein